MQSSLVSNMQIANGVHMMHVHSAEQWHAMCTFSVPLLLAEGATNDYFLQLCAISLRRCHPVAAQASHRCGSHAGSATHRWSLAYPLYLES